MHVGHMKLSGHLQTLTKAVWLLPVKNKTFLFDIPHSQIYEGLLQLHWHAPLLVRLN